MTLLIAFGLGVLFGIALTVLTAIIYAIENPATLDRHNR